MSPRPHLARRNFKGHSLAGLRRLPWLLLGCLLVCIAVGCLGKPPPRRGGDDDSSDDGAGESGDGNGAADASDDEDDGSGGTSNPDPDVEPGTCDSWKVAYCKWATTCNVKGQADCELSVGYISCLPDAPIEDCEETLADARKEGNCFEEVSACQPVAMADRTLPMQACQARYSAVCEHAFFCGSEISIEACVTRYQLALPCSGYTAVLPNYDQCMSEIAIMDCQTILPASCEGSIL